MAIDNTVRPGSNPDPITGAPGAHPVGVGLGAAAGGIAAGAVAGTLAAGPVGTAVGAAIGAVVGGLGGKAAAEGMNPSVEDDYWRENFANEPYYQSGSTYDDYSTAYHLGAEGPTRYDGKNFDDVEPQLESDYNSLKGESRLEWEHAKHATRAAWERVKHV